VYDDLLERLDFRPGGTSEPGCLFHYTIPTEDGFRDVWESMEVFHRLICERLGPVLEHLGIAQRDVTVYEVRNYVIAPPGCHPGSSVAARRPANRVAGSERLGASGRQGPGTSRQPGAPTSAAGRVVSRGRTPEAHLPTGDHARVRARVLPANKRTVPTASARKVRALRHSPGQQAGVEHRVLGIRHRQAVQVRNLSNPTPPTHAISRKPPARASEPAGQTAHRGSRSWNDTTIDR